jgi:hypothetical protein
MWRFSVGVMLLVGCDPSSSSDFPPPGSEVGAIGMVSRSAGTVTFAYTAETARQRLPEILAGQQPKDFQWVAITFRGMHAPDGALELSARLEDPAADVTFAHVYPGPCNPALQDFSDCLLFESVTSGDEGVSGSIQLHLANEASGAYDVVFEGITDRFGEPSQWHRLQSVGNFVVPILGHLGEMP